MNVSEAKELSKLQLHGCRRCRGGNPRVHVKGGKYVVLCEYCYFAYGADSTITGAVARWNSLRAIKVDETNIRPDPNDVYISVTPDGENVLRFSWTLPIDPRTGDKETMNPYQI